MNKVRIIRIVEILLLAVIAYVAWCLAYEITVGLRYNPKLFPSEGATRFALLAQQQIVKLPDMLVLAPQHLMARLRYPGTQGEAVLRGLLALGGVVTLLAGLVILRLATKPPKPFGDARFGTLAEAGKAKLLKDGGIVLGKMNGVPLRSADEGHLLVVGPTRSGKGVGFVLPNLYEWEGSALVLDWKEENFDNSAAHRMAMGHKIFKFAPGSESSHRYNPLDFVRRGPAMPTDCDTIATFVIKSFGGEDIWPKAARLLVSGLCGYVLTSKRTEGERHFRAVARMLVTGEDLSVILKTIIELEGSELPQWVIDRFRQYMAQPEKTRGSVLFNLNTALAVWSNDLISAVTQTSDFDIRSMRRDKITIYVCCNVSESKVFNLLISLLIQQIHDLNMRDLPSKEDKHKIMLLLDEFYYAGKMVDVLDKISISAGYGFRMAIVVQSISQLDELYGQHMRILAVSSSRVKLIMQVNDDETARYVSEALGSKTVSYKTPMIRPGAGLFGQRTYTPHLIERPLMTPAEIKEMSERDGLLLIPNAKPFKFTKIRHFADQPYKRIWSHLINRKPETPDLPKWIDRADLIIDDDRPSKPRASGKDVIPPPPSEAGSRQPTPFPTHSQTPVSPLKPTSPPPPADVNCAPEPLVAVDRSPAKKRLALAAPVREAGDVCAISKILDSIADAVQVDNDQARILSGNGDASPDQDAFTATLDAFGEDDPDAADALRSERIRAREARGPIQAGDSAPAQEFRTAAPDMPEDRPTVANAEDVPADDDTLRSALYKAKQANTTRKINLGAPNEPTRSSTDDTVRSLVAAMEKSAAKRAAVPKRSKAGQ